MQGNFCACYILEGGYRLSIKLLIECINLTYIKNTAFLIFFGLLMANKILNMYSKEILFYFTVMKRENQDLVQMKMNIKKVLDVVNYQVSFLFYSLPMTF